MTENSGPKSLADIIASRYAKKPPPAHQWQDLALRIIHELGIPNFKRASVFKVCKEMPKNFIEQSLNDTKELSKGKEAWKYFFKVIGNRGKDDRNGETAKLRS